MAQQIITLASEETSQEILTRVKNLELVTANIKGITENLWGGYKYTYFSGLSASKYFDISDNSGRMTFLFVRDGSTTVLSLTVDGVQILSGSGSIAFATGTYIEFNNSIKGAIANNDTYKVGYILQTKKPIS